MPAALLFLIFKHALRTNAVRHPPLRTATIGESNRFTPNLSLTFRHQPYSVSTIFPT